MNWTFTGATFGVILCLPKMANRKTEKENPDVEWNG